MPKQREGSPRDSETTFPISTPDETPSVPPHAESVEEKKARKDAFMRESYEELIMSAGKAVGLKGEKLKAFRDSLRVNEARYIQAALTEKDSGQALTIAILKQAEKFSKRGSEGRNRKTAELNEMSHHIEAASSRIKVRSGTEQEITDLDILESSDPYGSNTTTHVVTDNDIISNKPLESQNRDPLDGLTWDTFYREKTVRSLTPAELKMQDLVQEGFLTEGGDMDVWKMQYNELVAKLKKNGLNPATEGLPNSFQEILNMKDDRSWIAKTMRRKTPRVKLFEKIGLLYDTYVAAEKIDSSASRKRITDRSRERNRKMSEAGLINRST